MRIAFCTIASASYLPNAANLCESVRRIYGNDCDTFLLLIDRSRPEFDIDAKVLYFEDIPNPYRYDMALRYDLGELACAYKPHLMKFILASQTYDLVVFLDADIEVFSQLEELETAIENGAAIVFTPHSVVPRRIGRPIDDRGLLHAGPINAGFVALGRSPRAAAFLEWWEYLLRTECYRDAHIGYLMRDQKWIMLAPYYFEDVHILRHPGYNVAHFNVAERFDWLAEGLRFFHFTQLPESSSGIDEFFDRHAIDDNPDLRELAGRLPRKDRGQTRALCRHREQCF